MYRKKTRNIFSRNAFKNNAKKLTKNDEIALIRKRKIKYCTISCGRYCAHILIRLSPYHHLCCIVSLIASFCSTNAQY